MLKVGFMTASKACCSARATNLLLATEPGSRSASLSPNSITMPVKTNATQFGTKSGSKNTSKLFGCFSPLAFGNPLRFALMRSFWRRAGEKSRPSQLPGRVLPRYGHLHRHLRHGIHDPVKIVLPDRCNLSIGRRIQEIDRIRHSSFHGKLDGIQVVPQYPAKRQRIFFYAILQRRRRRWRITLHIALMMRQPGIVLHDMYLLLPDYIAPVILFKHN